VPPDFCLYELDHLIVHAGSVEKKADRILVVETPPAQWAYAVEVPLRRDPSYENATLDANVEICVDSGLLGIGILSRDGRAFRHEVQVGPEGGAHQTFEFLIGPVVRSARSSSVMLRARVFRAAANAAF
jgi:hypothetical protein